MRSRDLIAAFGSIFTQKLVSLNKVSNEWSLYRRAELLFDLHLFFFFFFVNAVRVVVKRYLMTSRFQRSSSMVLKFANYNYRNNLIIIAASYVIDF